MLNQGVKKELRPTFKKDTFSTNYRKTYGKDKLIKIDSWDTICEYQKTIENPHFGYYNITRCKYNDTQQNISRKILLTKINNKFKYIYEYDNLIIYNKNITPDSKSK